MEARAATKGKEKEREITINHQDWAKMVGKAKAGTRYSGETAKDAERLGTRSTGARSKEKGSKEIAIHVAQLATRHEPAQCFPRRGKEKGKAA